MRYHLIDEGAFSADDLAGREGLPALLFRLENASDPSELAGLAEAVLAWITGHPGFRAARAVFVEMPGAALAPLAPGVRLPEGLLEVRNMLVTMEAWAKQSLLEAEQRGEQRGRQQGEQRGEAMLLLRQMEERFGALPRRSGIGCWRPKLLR